MAVYYQPRDHFSDGYIRCPVCYGNGREIVKRESWEPPIYGDNTTACRECGGTGEVQGCWPDDDAAKEEAQAIMEHKLKAAKKWKKEG